MSVREIFGLLKETFKEWSEDKAPRLGAALAYYTVFSLAPLLIIAIGVASLVLDRAEVEAALLAEIQGLVGAQGQELIGTMLQNAFTPAAGIAATVIGLVTLIFGALGVFGQLQDALNTIWEVAPKPGRGIKGLIQDRLLSLTMVLGVGFLLLVSLVINTALAALGNFLGSFMGETAFLLGVLNFVLSFGVISLLFTLTFKYVPDIKIAWGDVWIGGALTALLFTIGKFLIGLYLGNTAAGSTYGAAGALVVVLLWVYYSAQILFLGAEFTQVYANRYGSRVRPASNAVPVTEEARAQQGMPRQDMPRDSQRQPARPTPVQAPGRVGPQAAAYAAGPAERYRRQVRGERNYLSALLSFVAGLSAGAMVALEAVRRKEQVAR